MHGFTKWGWLVIWGACAVIVGEDAWFYKVGLVGDLGRMCSHCGEDAWFYKVGLAGVWGACAVVGIWVDSQMK